MTETGPLRIVVADDEPLLVEEIGVYLAEMGHSLIATAATGQELLRLCVEHLPDLVITDILMPDMDGLEAARRIRDDVGDHRVPIIAVTAFLAQVGRENCMRSGMNDYIEKPFQRETILGVLRKWVAFE